MQYKIPLAEPVVLVEAAEGFVIKNLRTNLFQRKLCCYKVQVNYYLHICLLIVLQHNNPE